MCVFFFFQEKDKMFYFLGILLTPIRKNKPDTSHRDEHNKNTRLPEEYNLLPIYAKREYYQKINTVIRIT